MKRIELNRMAFTLVEDTFTWAPFSLFPNQKGTVKLKMKKRGPEEDPIEKGDPKIKSYYIKTIKEPN